MSLFASNKRYILSFVSFFLLLGFSLSAEARFGGRESHQVEHQPDEVTSPNFYSYHCPKGSKERRCRVKPPHHEIESKYVFFLLGLIGVGVGLPFLYLWLVSSRKPPKDINKLAFTRLLRERFMLLQTLWNEEDWDEIGQYVDPSLLYSLEDIRIRTRGRDGNTTTIRNLSTYIKSFKTSPDLCDVKVEFSGLDNEIYFKEEWTFRRSGGDWAPWIVMEIIKLK